MRDEEIQHALGLRPRLRQRRRRRSGACPGDPSGQALDLILQCRDVRVQPGQSLLDLSERLRRLAARHAEASRDHLRRERVRELPRDCPVLVGDGELQHSRTADRLNVDVFLRQLDGVAGYADLRKGCSNLIASRRDRPAGVGDGRRFRDVLRIWDIQDEPRGARVRAGSDGSHDGRGAEQDHDAAKHQTPMQLKDAASSLVNLHGKSLRSRRLVPRVGTVDLFRFEIRRMSMGMPGIE